MKFRPSEKPTGSGGVAVLGEQSYYYADLLIESLLCVRVDIYTTFSSVMRRVVVQAKKFSEKLDELIKQRKISSQDFDELEKARVANPEGGDPIQDTGGLRKIRLRSTSHGKSGGFRVCYLDVKKKEKLFFLVIYGKNEKENLSKEETKILKSIVDKIKEE